MANINEEDLEPMSFEDIALDIDDKAQLAKDIYDNDNDNDDDEDLNYYNPHNNNLLLK